MPPMPATLPELDLMRRYVQKQKETRQYDVWLAKKVEQSRTSAEVGNLIPVSGVEARFSARRAATRMAPPVYSAQTRSPFWR